MEEEKEILTKKEQIMNIIYYIFRYTLYLLGFVNIYLISGELITIITFLIFLYFSALYNENKQKIERITISRTCEKYSEIIEKEKNKNKEEEK